MPQGDGQQDDPPQTFDREVIAAVSAGSAEAGEEILIGDGVEKVAERDEGGAIVEAAPGKQRLRSVDVHGKSPVKSCTEVTSARTPPGKSVVGEKSRKN